LNSQNNITFHTPVNTGDLPSTTGSDEEVAQRFTDWWHNPDVALRYPLVLDELAKVDPELQGIQESNLPGTNEESFTNPMGSSESFDEPAYSEELAKIDQLYRPYIEFAKTFPLLGFSVAAVLLQQFLDGPPKKDATIINGKREYRLGYYKIIDSDWLRKFAEVNKVTDSHKNKIVQELKIAALNLKDGEVIYKKIETENSPLHANIKKPESFRTPQLFFASGSSEIFSVAHIEISRTGDFINMSGDVVHNWHDPYDWHKGLQVKLPHIDPVKGGLSYTLPDDYAVRLHQEGHARPFEMKSFWKENLHGTIEIRDHKISYESFEWHSDKINYVP